MHTTCECLRRFTAVLLIALAAAPAWAASPFTATAQLGRTGSNGLELAVAFGMKPEHFLYVDRLKIEAEGVALTPESIPAPKMKQDTFSGETVAVYDDDVVLRYRLAGDIKEPLILKVALQGCNAELCFLPETRTLSVQEGRTEGAGALSAASTGAVADAAGTGWRERIAGFKVGGTAAGYLKSSDFLDFLSRAETGKGEPRDSLAVAFQTRGTWAAVLIILLGGLLLNFTPCVLPMIPINLAIIGAGSQAGSRGRGFLLGGVYGLGIALVYGMLGLVVILTGSRFGALNASPWFNLAIAAVFVVMALAMFGLINVDFSRFQGAGGAGGRRGRLATAFALGGMAALLAGACVAPVLISVLLLSADLKARGNPAGLFLPFVLGVGMALPWPFAGAGLSFLPKPGQWMERVKYGFGVLILLFAAWYGFLGYTLLRDRAASMPGAAAPTPGTIEEASGWLTSLDEALRQSQAARKPVIIDFWASWCKNCLHMDKTTFKDPAVIARLDGYVRLKFHAEDLSGPGVKEVLDHFGVIGLPTYVVLKPPAGP